MVLCYWHFETDHLFRLMLLLLRVIETIVLDVHFLDLDRRDIIWRLRWRWVMWAEDETCGLIDSRNLGTYLSVCLLFCYFSSLLFLVHVRMFGSSKTRTRLIFCFYYNIFKTSLGIFTFSGGVDVSLYFIIHLANFIVELFPY